MKTKTNIGQFNAYYPISNLKSAAVNRDLALKHAENFKAKLNEYGWLMPVVVSSKGDVIEGHHRIQAAKLLKFETVPAYIVDWVDTETQQEHLDCIISLNNGNKAWTKLDYLKSYAKENSIYATVLQANIANETISVGNIINCYFGGSGANFKKGKAEIKSLSFAKFLIKNISRMYAIYGTKRVTAYCVRELIKLGQLKTKYNKEATQYLFDVYDDLCRNDDPKASSITRFRPFMEEMLNKYNNK